jgi:hypothetical protein
MYFRIQVQAINEGLNQWPVVAGQRVHTNFDGCAHRGLPAPYAGITRVRFNGFAGESISRLPTSQVSPDHPKVP